MLQFSQVGRACFDTIWCFVLLCVRTACPMLILRGALRNLFPWLPMGLLGLVLFYPGYAATLAFLSLFKTPWRFLRAPATTGITAAWALPCSCLAPICLMSASIFEASFLIQFQVVSRYVRTKANSINGASGTLCMRQNGLPFFP